MAECRESLDAGAQGGIAAIVAYLDDKTSDEATINLPVKAQTSLALVEPLHDILFLAHGELDGTANDGGALANLNLDEIGEGLQEGQIVARLAREETRRDETHGVFLENGLLVEAETEQAAGSCLGILGDLHQRWARGLEGEKACDSLRAGGWPLR